jgi:hypothetical protein
MCSVVLGGLGKLAWGQLGQPLRCRWIGHHPPPPILIPWVGDLHLPPKGRRVRVENWQASVWRQPGMLVRM